MLFVVVVVLVKETWGIAFPRLAWGFVKGIGDCTICVVLYLYDI